MKVTDNTKTVLIVEDEPDINSLLRRHLERSVFNTYGVHSVEAAIAYIEAYGAPDAMVLDLILGDRCGVEVLDYLKTKQMTKTRVIVLSANAFSHDIDYGIYPVELALLKPVSPRGVSIFLHDLFQPGS